jgi:ELWxxDGT repeat protein
MSKTVVLFEGGDALGDVELWETSGTAAGTVEITNGFEAGTGGLNPSFITAYGGEALFDGANATGSFGLWATNGTASGTHQITGIKGANPGGLHPMYMHSFNGEVLFRGLAGVLGNHVPGLWATKGTAASTVEIGGAANAGIHNVFSGGLLPGDPDFTDFNGLVYFAGQDAAGNVGLWRTDGTASGTFELDPIKGAVTVGSPGSDIQPSYMTVLGTEMLFEGADKRDTPGSLWETDGTAAGTVEIGGQGNAGIKGSPNGFTGPFTSESPLGIQPNDITAFNGKALFAGFDNTLGANGYYVDTDALWITDGTAAGTVEIGGRGNAQVKGHNSAQNGGLFWYGDVEYPDFTVLKTATTDIALFVGRDSDNHIGLWRTDGTVAGTYEIGGLDNGGIHGGLSLSDSQSPDMTLYNGHILFNGTDSGGHSGLWITNGTAAGTHELAVSTLSSPGGFAVVTL